MPRWAPWCAALHKERGGSDSEAAEATEAAVAAIAITTATTAPSVTIAIAAGAASSARTAACGHGLKLWAAGARNPGLEDGCRATRL